MAKKVYSIIFTLFITLFLVTFLSIRCEAQIVTYKSYARVTNTDEDVEVIVFGYNQTAGISQILSYNLDKWNSSYDSSERYWKVDITVPDDGCKWLINGTMSIRRWTSAGYYGTLGGGSAYSYPKTTETYPFSLSTTTSGTFVKPTINSEGVSSSLHLFKFISNVNFSEPVYELISGNYGDVTNKTNDWVKAVTYTEPTTNIKYSIIEGKFNSAGNKQIPIGGKLLLFKIIGPPTLLDIATVSFN